MQNRPVVDYATPSRRRLNERVCWTGLILSSVMVFWLYVLAWQLVIAAQYIEFHGGKMIWAGEMIMRLGWYATRTPVSVLIATVIFVCGISSWVSAQRPPDYDWARHRKNWIRAVGLTLFIATVVTLLGITIHMPMLLSVMTLKRNGFPW